MIHLRAINSPPCKTMELNYNLFRPTSAEEIFQDRIALWPSLDGTLIAYASFNDTPVSVSQYPWFSSASSMSAMGVQSGSAFPEMRNIRYPTPGTTLPTVLLHVLDVSNVTDIKRHVIQPPQQGVEGQ